MNYLELQKETQGKKFIRQSDMRVFTRTEWFFATTEKERYDAMNGDERFWILRDKTGWVHGEMLPEFKKMLLHN
jgi:hypothetical protein